MFLQHLQLLFSVDMVSKFIHYKSPIRVIMAKKETIVLLGGFRYGKNCPFDSFR